MSKTIVMCRPDYFDVAYELNTNLWMNLNEKPNLALAKKQWQALYDGCKQKGLEVMLALPKLGLPDMTFIANAGLFCKEIFIVSNYYHSERRGESWPNGSFFHVEFNAEIIFLPEGAYFEGQGDAVWLDDKRVLIGYGVRTNWKGIREVRRILKAYYRDVEVIALPMRPVRRISKNRKIFYHLDTCLFYMKRANAFLIYDYPFLPAARRKLAELGKVIIVTSEQAHQFVCNAVTVDDKTVFLPWADNTVLSILNEHGYPNVEVFPMSEFMKSGGAVKCLIFEV